MLHFATMIVIALQVAGFARVYSRNGHRQERRGELRVEKTMLQDGGSIKCSLFCVFGMNFKKEYRRAGYMIALFAEVDGENSLNEYNSSTPLCDSKCKSLMRCEQFAGDMEKMSNANDYPS